jgi:hypothetical protein
MMRLLDRGKNLTDGQILQLRNLVEREMARREQYPDEQPKPCGEHHPLPCGLDEACPVPVDYHDVDWSNERVVDAWGAGDA